MNTMCHLARPANFPEVSIFRPSCKSRFVKVSAHQRLVKGSTHGKFVYQRACSGIPTAIKATSETCGMSATSCFRLAFGCFTEGRENVATCRVFIFRD